MFLAREPIKDAAVKLVRRHDVTKEPKRKAAALKPKNASQAGTPPARRRARSANAQADEDGESMMTVKQNIAAASDPRCASGRSMPMTAPASGCHGRRKAGDGIDEAPLIALGRRARAGRAARRAAAQTAHGRASCSAEFGGRITGSAKDAADAAKEAGREKLAELGLTRDAGAERGPVDARGRRRRGQDVGGQAALGAVRDKG